MQYLYINFKLLDKIHDNSDENKKSDKQLQTLNFINKIEKNKINCKILPIDLTGRNEHVNINKNSEKENFYFEINNYEIEKNIFASNLNEFNNKNSNLNLKKLKIDNFQEKISNSKLSDLKKKQSIQNNSNNRFKKIKNFIQGITNSANNDFPNNNLIEKKEINNSINYREKNKPDFELDSDYDLFLTKPLTDREERETLKTILKIPDKVQPSNEILKDESSFGFEEGESREFNERVMITNNYNPRYNNMINLYYEHKK